MTNRTLYFDEHHTHLQGWCSAETKSVGVYLGETHLGNVGLTETRPDVVQALNLDYQNVGFNLFGGSSLYLVHHLFSTLKVSFRATVDLELDVKPDFDKELIEANETNIGWSFDQRNPYSLTWSEINAHRGEISFSGFVNTDRFGSIEFLFICPNGLHLGELWTLADLGKDATGLMEVSVQFKHQDMPLLIVGKCSEGNIIALDFLPATFVFCDQYKMVNAALSDNDIDSLASAAEFLRVNWGLFRRTALQGIDFSLQDISGNAIRLPSPFHYYQSENNAVIHTVPNSWYGVDWCQAIDCISFIPRSSYLQCNYVIYDEARSRTFIVESAAYVPEHLSEYAVFSPTVIDKKVFENVDICFVPVYTYIHHRLTSLNKKSLLGESAQKNLTKGRFLFASRASSQASWSLSVVVSFKNKSNMTIDFLQSVLGQQNRHSIEFVVINNQSSLEEYSVVERFLESIRNDHNVSFKLLEYNENFNHSAQTNLGVQASSNEIVLIANNDILLPEKDSIMKMAAYVGMDAVATVGCVMLSPHQHHVHSAKFSSCGMFMKKRLDPVFEVPVVEDRLPVLYYPPAILTAGNTFGFCLIKKERFHQLGKADAVNFPIDYNDVDFCLRASEQGFYHVTDLTTSAYHIGRASRGNTRNPEFRRGITDFGSINEKSMRAWLR